MIDILIFSRNRSMQLHCLLSSLKEHSNISHEKINVLHRYDEDYKNGLETVQQLHSNVNFIEESNFENQVKHYLNFGEKHLMFLVDDIIVKDKIDFSVPCSLLSSNPEMLCFSLRLGTHLTECYPMASAQTVPNGNIVSSFFIWKWKSANFDWGYPLSVDGHIFRRSELEGWASYLKFNNPNQFESSLQEIPKKFVIPLGMISYLNSKIFNNPTNRVQNEFINRTESEMSPEKLNELWQDGFEIDYSNFKGYLNPAAHTPIKLCLRKR